MIYPDFIFLSGLRILAACPCGVAGEPHAIGWMGDCCAACHDRREEGQEIANPGKEHLLEPWPSPDDGVHTITYSPDGSKLAGFTWSERGAILVKDQVGGEDQRWSLADQGPLPNDLVFLPDGHTLAFTHGDEVLLLDIQTGQRRSSPFKGHNLQRLGVSPDGTVLITQDGSEELSAWDLHTGRALFTVPGGNQAAGACCATLSPDGRLLVVGCGDGALRLWSIADRREIVIWPDPQQAGGRITELAFSSDGRFLASLADEAENNLTIWDADKGTVHAPLKLDRQGSIPNPWCRSMAFAPASYLLAASDLRGTVVFWDVLAGSEPITLASAPELDVTPLAFSPCGHWLARVRYTRPVRFWPWRALLDGIR
jgi:WD40 repeat protein